MSNLESILLGHCVYKVIEKKRDLRFQRHINISVRVNYSNPNVSFIFLMHDLFCTLDDVQTRWFKIIFFEILKKLTVILQTSNDTIHKNITKEFSITYVNNESLMAT